MTKNNLVCLRVHFALRSPRPRLSLSLVASHPPVELPYLLLSGCAFPLQLTTSRIEDPSPVELPYLLLSGCAFPLQLTTSRTEDPSAERDDHHHQPDSSVTCRRTKAPTQDGGTIRHTLSYSSVLSSFASARQALGFRRRQSYLLG